jgi:hypothetical protein
MPRLPHRATVQPAHQDCRHTRSRTGRVTPDQAWRRHPELLGECQRCGLTLSDVRVVQLARQDRAAKNDLLLLAVVVADRHDVHRRGASSEKHLATLHRWAVLRERRGAG